jgi:hypothetical protein
MKLAVIDTNYKPSEKYFGLAASWLRWEIERRGLVLYDPKDADTWLMTTSSQQGLTGVTRWLKLRTAKQHTVILGGGGCYAPAVFDGLVDACCVGEGKAFIDALLDNGIDKAMSLDCVWVAGQTQTVTPSQDFPWDVPPIMHPDGRVRIPESRGCKQSCLFCQTGWERHYIEHPSPEKVKATAINMNKLNIKWDVLTNDSGHGITQTIPGSTVSSMTYKTWQSMPTNTMPRAIRIGVEGVSERLRRAVGKPITNAELFKHTKRSVEAGKVVRLFFILGLPLETQADYQDLYDLTIKFGELDRGLVHLTFHAYIPQPATPLCVFPLVDEYLEPFEEYKRAFFDGHLNTNRVQIVSPAKYPTRLKNAKRSMCATEKELRRGWWTHDNANWRVKYNATPNKLRQIATKYEAMVTASGRQSAPKGRCGGDMGRKVLPPDA